jgi:hypothetical protein
MDIRRKCKDGLTDSVPVSSADQAEFDRLEGILRMPNGSTLLMNQARGGKADPDMVGKLIAKSESSLPAVLGSIFIIATNIIFFD